MFATINHVVRSYLRKNPFAVNILIAVWTLLQSMFQLSWLLLGHYMYNCLMRPTSYDLAFLYITYFYREQCGEVNFGKDEVILSETKFFWFIPGGNGTELYVFMKDVLAKGIFPEEVLPSWRTNAYIQTSLVFESFWGFASVTLLIGACFKIQSYWIILFSGPWLVVTGLNVLLDVVSAVHFGLDIRLLSSYTKWLQFIGVKNHMDFVRYNGFESSSVFPILPSIVLVLLFSRIFFVWILNILCFMNILNRYIEMFQNRGNSQRRSSRTTRLSCNNGQEIDLNSSEARIRNWQLFYGAIGSTSTLTSTCSSDNEHKKKINYEADFTLQSTSQDDAGHSVKCHNLNQVRIIEPVKDSCKLEKVILCEPSCSTVHDKCFDNHNFLEGNPNEADAGRPSIGSTYSTYYCKFSEPNYPSEETGTGTSKPNPLLRSQLPWSYLNPKDVRTIDSGNIRHQLQIANNKSSSNV